MKKAHITRMGSVKHSEQNAAKASLIKVSVDQAKVHYWAVRQVDNGPIEPPQRFTPEKFLWWIEKQQQAAQRVVVCYESGPFGFVLARQLQAKGIECLVIAPFKLDEYNRRVNTDKTDALEIANRLDRYLAGNRRAIRPVHILSALQEQQRAESRHYGQLRQHHRRIQVQAKSLLLCQGYQIKGQWWTADQWAKWQQEFPQWLSELLASFSALLRSLDEQLQRRKEALEASAQAHLPKELPALPLGIGPLGFELVRRELGEGQRFKNRRAVGSFIGLCASEASTGMSRQQGPVTKHGNPRLRAILVELAWRLTRFQPHYKPVVFFWKRIVSKAKSTAATRKKAIVAVARRLAIDLWRLLTGQTTAAKLGLLLKGNRVSQAVSERAGVILGAQLRQA